MNTARSGRCARLPDEPRRHRARSAGAVDEDAGGCVRQSKGLGVSVNYGFAELKEDFSKDADDEDQRTSRRTPATFNVSRGAAELARRTRSVVRRDTFVVTGASRHVDVDAERAGRDGRCVERRRPLLPGGRRPRAVHAAAARSQQRHRAARPVLPRPACALGHQDEAGKQAEAVEPDLDRERHQRRRSHRR